MRRQSGLRTPAALLVLAACCWGCTASGRRSLKPMRDALRGAESIRVDSTGSFAASYFAVRVEEALRACRPRIEVRAEGDADVEIVWHDDHAGWICLDYWEPSCDPQLAIVDISDGKWQSNWSVARPNKCIRERCVLEIFLQDLAKAVCGRPIDRIDQAPPPTAADD